MVNACIGTRGFIGSAILRVAKIIRPDEEWVGITRDNYQMWRGYNFNIVVFAGGSASKELCEDWNYAYDINVNQVKQSIKDFPCSKFIYISSQAVYPPTYGCPDETVDIDETELGNYGRSKYLGELVVKEHSSNFVVVRPNGFTGKNLKKNAVYSMSLQEPQLYYARGSYAQYIHVDKFASILLDLSKHYTNNIYNLTSPDIITMDEIADLLNVDINLAKPARQPLPLVKAWINTEKMVKDLLHIDYTEDMLPTSKQAITYWNKELTENTSGR